MAYHRESSRGFTLIEVMIVVAIIAILASIAYPSYAESVRKGRRAQARSALVELMQQQERYMTQRNTYMVFSTAAAAAVAGATFKVYSGDSPTNPAYSLTANVCPVDSNGNQPDATVCIKLIARPNTPDPKLTEINLTSTGIKDCILNAGFTDKKICWP